MCGYLATAARVKYPAALQRYKLDTPLLAAGSLISEMLVHEDESTTIRHYLYNVNDEETTDQIVLDALQGKKEPEYKPETAVGQREVREVKVIPFQTKEKAGKPSKYGLPANS